MAAPFGTPSDAETRAPQVLRDHLAHHRIVVDDDICLPVVAPSGMRSRRCASLGFCRSPGMFAAPPAKDAFGGIACRPISQNVGPEQSIRHSAATPDIRLAAASREAASGRCKRLRDCSCAPRSLRSRVCRLAAPGDSARRRSGSEPISPVRPAGVSDTGKVALGEALFHDRRLSHGDAIACATCHHLDQGGDDQRKRPIGAAGQQLDFNAPTVFNAALNFRLNWRGNFRSLEEQNEAVLLDPRLMGTRLAGAAGEAARERGIRRGFASLYGAPPKREHVLDALAAFQHSLTTPRARFDRYLGGELDAISAEEERGYQLFKSYGCVACHQGENVGGNLFQKFGVFGDPRGAKAIRLEADLGRFTITAPGAPIATCSACRACATWR